MHGSSLERATQTTSKMGSSSLLSWLKRLSPMLSATLLAARQPYLEL